MDAVTPFLRDACVVLPWLVLAALWRSAHWASIVLVGTTLFLVGSLALLSPGGTLAVLAGTAGVIYGRSGGMKPRRLAALCSLSGAATIALYAGWFHVALYRPWVAEVRAVQERYPPVPRDSLLPTLSADEPITPHPGIPAWSGPYRPWHAGASDPRPEDPFLSGREPDEIRRTQVLHRLHGMHRELSTRFASELGFGIVRGRRIGVSVLREPDQIAAFPQPGEARLGFDGSLDPLADDGVSAALAEYHTARGIDFAHAPGFGVLARGDGSPGDAALPGDADPADGPFLIGVPAARGPHRRRRRAADAGVAAAPGGTDRPDSARRAGRVRERIAAPQWARRRRTPSAR